MIAHERPVIANALWSATAGPIREWPVLSGEVNADVVIVGGGVTGLSAALHLAETGAKVVLLEAQTPGWGASGRNGGQLNPGLKHDPQAVIAAHGAEMGGRMLRLSGDAPRFVGALVQRLGIDCDFVQPGWIQPAHDAGSMQRLEARAAEWAAQGVGLRLLDGAEVCRLIGTDVYTGGLLDPRGANVHPLKFTLGLAAAAEKAGARIYGQSAVSGLTRVGGRHRVRTAAGAVLADQVLLCTNGYTDGLMPGLRRSLVPVRSVQVATAPLPDALLAQILPDRQAVADTRRVMVYYKRDGAGRLLMGGRGDYADGATAALLENLRRLTRAMFPALAEIRFDYSWGGFVAITADHYPHLVDHGQGIHSALGYNGRGLALGTAMGRVLADWSAGKDAAALDFPVTAMAPMPFHGFHKLGVRAAVAVMRARDALGI